jgi:hypothetical protein
MFRVVEGWWRDMDDRYRNELRQKLSRQGVENGDNHKEGVHDTGHGCGKPLGMPNLGTSQSSGAIGGVLGEALQQATGISGVGGSSSSKKQSSGAFDDVGKVAGDAVGGGALGGLVGGLVGGVGASLLGGSFEEDEKKKYKSEKHGKDGSYTESYTETGHRREGSRGHEKYGQASYSQTDYPGGGHKEEYRRYEQEGYGGSTGYGYEHRTETSGYSAGGGYSRTEERKYEHPGGQWESQTRTEGFGSSGDYYQSEKK